MTGADLPGVERDMLALAIVNALLVIVVAYLFYNYLQHAKALTELSAEATRARSDVDHVRRVLDAITIPAAGDVTADATPPARKRKRSRRP
jgi:hypothetical protein